MTRDGGIATPFSRGSSRAADGSLERGRSALLSEHEFRLAIGWGLHLLAGSHVPLSLFAVQLAPAAVAAEAVVSEALHLFGKIGRLPDHHIGLFYLGPRSLAAAGERTLTEQIFARMERRLRDRGFAALAASVRLIAVHGWSDEVASLDQLLHALAASAGGNSPPSGARRLL